MPPRFRPLRRRWFLLLTIALAGNFYPTFERDQGETQGGGRSAPWLYDESSLAVIEISAEFEQAKGSVSTGRQSGLASLATFVLQAPPAWLPSHDGQRPYRSRDSLFPNKTGPPSR